MEYEVEVRRHHELVRKMLKERGLGERLLFTVLFGSQNYRIHTENSDIDTITFVLPSYDTLILNAEPVHFEKEVEDGKCTVYDIRKGLQLLRKPSPNSIEWFLSPYMVIEPQYNELVRDYFDNHKRLYYMVHCDFRNFMMACYGCSKGLHSRNMPPYKKFGHALRMQEMQMRYISNKYNPSDYLLLWPGDRETIKQLKYGFRAPYQNDEYFEEQVEEIAGWCKIQAENIDYNLDWIKSAEAVGKLYVKEFQEKLFDIYFKELVDERATNHVQ